MRWIAACLVVALAIASAAPVSACDPDWEWCGGYGWNDAWYDPYWYEPTPEPAYEPSWYEPTWYWWDEPVYQPVYEPAPAYEPVAVYIPAPVYEPTPVFEPAPVSWYEPAVTYEPVTTYTPFIPYEPTPVYASIEPSPVVVVPAVATPAWTDPVVWTSPGSEYLDAQVIYAPAPAPVAVSPDPDTRRAELGLHWVTDVYVRDEVTTAGLVTTYSTASAPMAAGTTARLVATVATGEASSFDGLVFNGRMTRADGQAVSGSVYANYVWDGYDWIFDRYVFFQDDSEIGPIAAPVALPPAPGAEGPPPAPVIEPPAFVAPLVEGAGPDAPSVPTSDAVDPVRQRDVRAGIALAPQGDPLGRIEVLRGRRIALWVRATVDGSPARVIAWTLASGDLAALGPVRGSGEEPLVAMWPSVATTAFPIRIVATVEVPIEGSREIETGIEVIVRSPALAE